MKMDKEINALLKSMHSKEVKEKGTTAEMGVVKICEEFYQEYGGILYHSYTYKVDKDLQGNIKRNDNGNLYVENLGATTEIDILLVTPFRVFPIEAKAYRTKKITFTDDGVSGCAVTNKSPIHQHEMHCRHLYSHIFKSLPDGDTSYIVPIVCMIDKAQLEDKRSSWQKDYIKLCTINSLREVLIKYNVPGKYMLDLKSIDMTLKEASTDHVKYFPLRV
jgi:hypothetical protein